MTDISDLKSLAAGDFAQPFLIDHSNIRGRLVRLNEVVDTILTRHEYPEPVSRLLGELLVVAAMLSGNLKHQGMLTLQIKGEGLVRFVVVDVEFGGKLRGYAEMAEGAEEALKSMDAAHHTPSLQDMVGNGYLAITLDNTFSKQPYQGIVELSGKTVAETVQSYFSNSEQSEVRLKICVGSMQYGGEERAQWCAGGMLLQHVPGEQGGGHFTSDAEAAVRVHDAADDAVVQMRSTASTEPDPELWHRISLFYDTLKPYELLDPLLPTEELLYRLFNEDGVWMYQTAALHTGCRCTRERISKVLSSFPREELQTMLDDEGRLSVNCQFCNKQ
jgi:molecular chaperone Hsp33